MHEQQIEQLQQLVPNLPFLLPAYAFIAYGSYRLIQHLLPRRTELDRTWSAFEVIAVYLFVFMLIGSLTFYGIAKLELTSGYYPEPLVAAATDQDHAAQLERQIEAAGGPTAKLLWQEKVDRVSDAIQFLWTSALAVPWQVLCMPLVLWLGSRTTPAQLGLTRTRLGRNALLGVLCFVMIVPAVYGLHVMIELGYFHWFPKGRSDHPFTELSITGLLGVEKKLLILTAVLGAPLLEEIFFRGVVQGWATRSRSNAMALLPVALGMAVLHRWSRIGELTGTAGWQTWLDVLGPVFFVLLVAGVFAALWRCGCSAAWLGIVSTSLFFAIGHAGAWPSPIALIVLALGLGWLAQRTGSLIGPIVLHALFNAVACLSLLSIN